MILPYIYDVDISQPLLPTVLQPMMVTGDKLANRIGVRLKNGAQPYTPDGSCRGYVLRADGATVPILDGVVNGNEMYIDLPEAAYAVQGSVVISIVCVTATAITTVFLGSGSVNRSQTDVMIDPGTVIDDISTLIQEIETAVASIPQDYSTLSSNVTTLMSDVSDLQTADVGIKSALAKNYAYMTFPISKGEYCLYQGALFKAKQDIPTSESWTAAHWVMSVIGEDVAELKSAFDEKVGSKYATVNPENWFNGSATTEGILYANGTVSSSTTRIYTDYIPVSYNDVIRQYYGNESMPTIYRRNVCCYDSSKTVLPAKGTDSSGSTPWTVPSGVSYIRITIDKTYANKAIITKNLVPTRYTSYFAPYDAIIEDFLTNESESFLSSMMQNGISSRTIINKYGCALPQTKIFQTIGLPEKWYNDSMVTPPTTNIIASAGSQYTSRSNDGISFLNTTALTSSNGYTWQWYDVFYAFIKSSTGSAGYGWPRSYIDENLSDCSLLAIGDSTVDHDTMTATLLSHFADQGHTLTLLGTLGDGSGTNKNEGRAGWSAQDYLTDRQYQGVTNPFYNPTAQTFDFAYYMSNQGYTGVDFVVIQLGINDLYNYDDTKIVPTWEALETIIDSILAYNSGIKIILNLPTTPNSDQSELNVAEFLYRNRVIRYNEYAMAQSLAKYGTTKVRCSYCHLILDSNTEIRDNVHPTVTGYQKMALEVVNQINCWQAGV